MTKFEPLKNYLLTQSNDKFTLSFEQIENIIGATLPASKVLPGYWANLANPNYHALRPLAWMDAGYKCFLEKEYDRVRFERFKF